MDDKFEIAVRKVAEAMVSPLSKSADLYDDEDPQNELAAQGLHDLPDFQVTLKSEARLMQFRDLLVSHSFLPKEQEILSVSFWLILLLVERLPTFLS